jgi:apolipoprotein D and lipocalin family protein
MLFGTPGGHFIWLMSRQPVMTEADKAQMLGRATALGYDVKRLAFPVQSATP